MVFTTNGGTVDALLLDPHVAAAQPRCGPTKA
jgi:hypothetical protein